MEEKQDHGNALHEEIGKAMKLAEERLSQLTYLRADFENYRKNAEKEKRQTILFAQEGLILELLPLLDEMMEAILQTEGKNKEGLELLYTHFLNILEKNGVGSIETEGKPFDPFIHEAIGKEEGEDGMILKDVQKGYTLHGKVIRPSKVIIGASHGERKNHRD